MVKEKLLFQVKYFLFWVFFSLIAKIIFIAYQFEAFSGMSFSEIPAILINGIPLDLSIAAYISILPFLLTIISIYGKEKLIKKIITIYSLIVISIFSFIVVADAELFTYWGYRLDSTPLKYLNTPMEMINSTLSSPLLLLTAIFLTIEVFFTFLYLKIFNSPGKYQIAHKISVIPLAITTLGLIIPLRGGFQHIPINESVVYYSQNNLCNQAAINVWWNFSHSLLENSYDQKNPYTYLPKLQADSLFTSLYPEDTSSSFILNTRQPNIIFLIWESFTSKAFSDSVTPEVYNLAKEGLLFNNLYSSGDRSDKGLVALLSGYPAQPTTSIITHPTKNQKLPHLNQPLKNVGYQSVYIHGGDLEFANMKSYIFNSGYNEVIGKFEFDKKYWNSKWGAHDEIVLDKTLEKADQLKQPFFATTFTLSSHEPFEIPISPRFNGQDKETQFLNSLFYTDKCIGNFIREAKKKPWWDNTLIIIVADHGHPLPGSIYPSHEPSEFKIPMLWLGGALNLKDTINLVGSQCDVATTLLSQLNLPAQDFKFGKNLLSSQSKPFAYYSFNDGFGMIMNDKYFLFDNKSKKVIKSKGILSPREEATGKAYLQYSFEDFLNK